MSDGFYDNVLEADLTNNTLLGHNCKQLTSQLGLPSDASFSDCIEAVVQQLIKEECRALYRENFHRETLLARHAQGQTRFTFIFEEKSALTPYNWTRVTVFLYHSNVNQTVRLVSYVKNIQEEKERELRLQEQANTDYLTGLYNKRATEERISTILNAHGGDKLCHALLIVDVDHFKHINDSIGHQGGDRVLRAVAHLLQAELGASDILGRIGGDEFLLFLQDCKERKNVELMLDRLSGLSALPDIETQLGVALSFSIGAALYPEHAQNFFELFAAADRALYYAKEHGRNNCHME